MPEKLSDVESIQKLKFLELDNRLKRLQSVKSVLNRELTELISDKRLRKLEEIGWGAGFNVFDAMGVAEYEIRHSNLIAFFLDPKKNHGMGPSFYIDFCKHQDINIKLKHEPKQNDFVVRRELDHTDIVISDDTNSNAIVIENKFQGSESKGQLTRYRTSATKRYGQKNIYYFYLSLEKNPTLSDKRWKPISYSVILDILSRLMKRDNLREEVRFALSQYSELLISKL